MLAIEPWKLRELEERLEIRAKKLAQSGLPYLEACERQGTVPAYLLSRAIEIAKRVTT